MSGSFYETDFVAWIDQQANALRQLNAGSSVLDRDNLVEEIQALDRCEVREHRSHLQTVIEYMLKAASDPQTPQKEMAG